MRGRIRRALLKKLVRKLLKLSFEKSKIPSKLTSPDPSRPPSRGPGWCWVRFAQTPRRSPRRSPRRRSRARSTLRFPLARLKRSRAFSPLARREHLLRDLSFARARFARAAREMRLAFAPPLLDASPRDTDRARARARRRCAHEKLFPPPRTDARARTTLAPRPGRLARHPARGRPTTADGGGGARRGGPSVVIRRHRHTVPNRTLRVKSPRIITYKTHARRHASPYNRHRERLSCTER